MKNGFVKLLLPCDCVKAKMLCNDLYRCSLMYIVYSEKRGRWDLA